MGPSLFPLPFCFLLPLPLHPHLTSCLDQGHLPCMNVKPDSRWTPGLVQIQGRENKQEERAAGENREDRSCGQVPRTCFSFTLPVQLPTVSWVRLQGAACECAAWPRRFQMEAPGLLQPFCSLQAHPARWTPTAWSQN